METKTEASPVKDLRWEGRREGGRSRRRGPAALQGGACEGQGLAGEGGDGNGEEGQGKMGEEEDTGAQGEQGFGQKRALTGTFLYFIIYVVLFGQKRAINGVYLQGSTPTHNCV